MTGYIMPAPGCGSAWLERLVWDQEVAGSNPVTPIITCSIFLPGKPFVSGLPFSCRHFVHILLYTVPFPAELIPSGLSRPAIPAHPPGHPGSPARPSWLSRLTIPAIPPGHLSHSAHPARPARFRADFPHLILQRLSWYNRQIFTGTGGAGPSLCSNVCTVLSTWFRSN